MAIINGHKVITTVITKYLNVDDVYPVGAIYTSVNSTSPAALFGGTWQRIDSKFLYGTSDNGQLGQTGGEATHILTTNEIPSHNHNDTNSSSHYWGALFGDAEQRTQFANFGINVNEVNATVYESGVIASNVNTGGGAAHNNMPPYIKVAIWQRTA